MALLLAEMDISPKGIHVGLLQFGKYGQLRLEFGLNKVNSREKAVVAVQKFRYLNGRGTALGSALRKTRQVRASIALYFLTYSEILKNIYY